jgi:Zn-dependent protease
LIVLTVINTLLAFFNMLPFPPLDGSKVVGMLVSRRWPELTGRYFRYGSFLLLAILVLQVGFDIPVIPFDAITRLALRLVVE